MVLGNIGTVVRSRGDFERSVQIFEEVLAGMREIGDERGIASAISNLGLAFTDLGDLDQAKAYCLQAIVILERIGFVRSLALAQLSVADIAMTRGENAEAITWATESLGNLVACGDIPSSGVLLGMLGDLAFNVGEPVRSARLFGGAWPRSKRRMRRKRSRIPSSTSRGLAGRARLLELTNSKLSLRPERRRRSMTCCDQPGSYGRSRCRPRVIQSWRLLSSGRG